MGFLVLSRRVDEDLILAIDPHKRQALIDWLNAAPSGQAVVLATLRVVDVRHGEDPIVRLGTDAPADVAVHRAEVWREILSDRRNGVMRSVPELIAAAGRRRGGA